MDQPRKKQSRIYDRKKGGIEIQMATTNQTKSTGSKKRTAAASKSTGGKTKSSNSSTSRSAGSNSKAASAKGSGEKKTNSGGTLRTASKQASSTKSKQAKAASSTSAKRSTRPNGASSRNAASSRSRAGGAKKGNDGLVTRAVKAVGAMLSGGPPDALELLKKDHRKVDGLFSKAKANEDGNNAPVFRKIKAELDVHAHIEEKIFYPYILERGDQELNRLVREGIEEHKQIKMFLEDLAGLSGTTEKFRAKLKVLIEDVEHHVKEEEDEMFPMIREQIGDAALQKLAQSLEKEKVTYTKRTATGRKVRPAKQRAASA